jgi:dihydropteroate synthase
MDRDVKEIRVIVDPIIKYFKNGPKKENLDILNENKEFMDTVYKKITAAMDDEIQESIKNYDILKNNLEYSN